MRPRDPPDWELYDCVKLIPPVSTVGETFEVDHQDLGQGPQVKLLGGLLMLLTVGTVPRERRETTTKWGGSRAACTLSLEGEPQSPLPVPSCWSLVHSCTQHKCLGAGILLSYLPKKGDGSLNLEETVHTERVVL